MHIKKGIAPIIATVLLIAVAIVVTGTTAYYVIPMVSNTDISCLKALDSISFEDVGFTCTLPSSAVGRISAFSVRIASQDVVGFQAGFVGEGSADTYDIIDGKNHDVLCSLDKKFDQLLEVPQTGAVRTYIAKTPGSEIFISPILKSGKGCFREARKDLTIRTNCVNPDVRARVLNCIAGGGACGNNVADAGEACDGTDLGGKTCQDFNSPSGQPYYFSSGLVCSGCEFDKGGCTGWCGDGQCNGAETSSTCNSDCSAPKVPCNLTDLSWQTNKSVVENDSVQLTVSGTNCGDETIAFEIWEDDKDILFDGDDPAQLNPPSTVFVNGSNNLIVSWTAEWQCDGAIGSWCSAGNPEWYAKARVVSNPTVEVSSLQTINEEMKVSRRVADCGNGLIEGGEECDPSTSCQPPYGGSCNYCDSTCHNSTSQGQYCGDGSRNGAEQCDGSDLGSASCQSLGFSYGNLLCFSSGLQACTFDSSQCTNSLCGNGVVDAGEACDPPGSSCEVVQGSPITTGMATGSTGGSTGTCSSDCISCTA